MIELILAEDIPEIAKSGDTVILKDDNTFEIKKCEKPKEMEKGFADYKDFEDCKSKNRDKTDPDAYCRSIKHKVEDTKKEYDPRIEKYLSIDKEKSWSLLTKFYNAGHLDSYKVLKDFINKIATCPEVTDKFEKIMDGWMKDGEADTSAVEKIIDSCKKEGGNRIVEGNDKVAKAEHTCSICQKAEISPEQLKEIEAARRRQQAADEDTKIKPIGKSAEIIEAITKETEIDREILRNTRERNIAENRKRLEDAKRRGYKPITER